LAQHALGWLGVPKSGDLERHAWDIVISGVRRVLAEALNAALAPQSYSRLLHDCSGPSTWDISILKVGELTQLPKSMNLNEGSHAAAPPDQPIQ